MNDIEELELKLSTPSAELIQDMASIEGDIIILGVGGKMGPSLARLAARAIKEAGVQKRIIGVSRFSEPGLKESLGKSGIETIAIDLLDDEALNSLPEVKNVIFMAGRKFGTNGNEHLTWAMNTYLPGRVGEKFKNSRIVVFSSGNIYPFVPIGSGGATEQTAPAPIGEYAQSCLGRERIFQYFSHLYHTPLLIFRLNYAFDMRYGNLLEIAKMVKEEKTIDLTLGYMNVIWQGDANEIAIRCLLECESPPKIINVTGPETISIRWLAEEFGKMFNKKPLFTDQEAPDALLNNASVCFKRFGYPKVTLKEMMDMTYDWIMKGGKTVNKPTHFQERSGKY